MRDAAHHQLFGRSFTAWAKFMAGVLLLVSAVLVLMQGYTPPGLAGVVLRNNLRHDIDATPLFYTEVECLAPGE